MTLYTNSRPDRDSQEPVSVDDEGGCCSKIVETGKSCCSATGKAVESTVRATVTVVATGGFLWGSFYLAAHPEAVALTVIGGLSLLIVSGFIWFCWFIINDLNTPSPFARRNRR